MPSPWIIGPISTPTLAFGAFRAGVQHKCRFCGVVFFTGEKSGFCCGPNGNRVNDVTPLPDLPPQFNAFINDPDISKSSRILNMIFSFASLETTHEFPPTIGGPGFVSVQGKIYHRLRPDHKNSAVRWLLHDGFLMESAPFEEWAAKIPDNWKTAFKTALLGVNPFVQALVNLSTLDPDQCPSAQLLLQDAGSSEIAAVMVYDNTALAQVKSRTLTIARRSGKTSKIPTVSRMWEPLAYPLLFPHATLGWGLVSAAAEQSLSVAGAGDGSDAPTTQMWHYRARLLREERFSIFGRLTNEYLVDMFTRDLESRLAYIRTNQARIRKEDAELMGVSEDDLTPSEDIFLPASFLGSNRWAMDQVGDSLAIAAALGPPTFFITMTCNPECPEIKGRLRPGQDFSDIPIIVVRVFKLKLQAFMQALRTMFPELGKPLYIIHSVEFQKRGLPHAHILIKYAKDCIHPDDIDMVISVEMPSDPVDKALVMQFMLHNHPKWDRPPSKYCQKDTPSGKRVCRFKYPQALQMNTTIDPVSGHVNYRRRTEADLMVVPHCLPVIRKFKCHINWEVAGTGHLFQYLFKYIHKGPDMAKCRTVSGPPPPNALGAASANAREPIDEIEEFWQARYLSAGEAAWRIMGFHITRKEPAVSSLPIHLPDSRAHHQYHRASGDASTLSRLDRYFLRPNGSFIMNGNSRPFSELTYLEYNTLFRFEKYSPTMQLRDGWYLERSNNARVPRQCVILRDPSKKHIARMHILRPTHGDVYYLRLILLTVPAASFTDARTVNGRVFGSFQEAAVAAGLLNDTTEGLLAMKEAVETLRTPHQIRTLFVHLLANGCVETPLAMWEEFQDAMARDCIIRHNGIADLGRNDALRVIAKSLKEYGMTLEQFGLTPPPETQGSELDHEQEIWGAPEMREMLDQRAEAYAAQFTAEQHEVYESILQCVTDEDSLCLFVDGKAGTGKTTVIKAICDKVRALGNIVLPTASSAFAAQLYPGGQTAHYVFKVPVNNKSEFLVSKIDVNGSRAQLIAEASVIIIDEAPMANQAVLACIDDICKRIMQSDEPFGGKIVIILGDFRQTCPVIRGGTRAQVVAASIKSSPIWQYFDTVRLTQPIRNAEDPIFAQFVDNIGDGMGPEVPLDGLQTISDIDNFVDFAFPNGILVQPRMCLSRAILAPRNDQVDSYNSTILARLDGHSRTYLASDSIKEAENEGLPTPEPVLDYVRFRSPPGIPAHSLLVKVGGVYRVMRNFSCALGLVKNVRVVIINVGPRLITVRILKPPAEQEPHPDNDILLPRITIKSALSSGHTMLRRQFPLAAAYSTTFNSCQGLTLDRVAVDLTHPVFSHGQLYTAMSRIRNRTHAMFRVNLGQTTTTNVTFHELLA